MNKPFKVFVSKCFRRKESKNLSSLLKIEENCCVISENFKITHFGELSMKDCFLFAIIDGNYKNKSVPELLNIVGTYDFNEFAEINQSLRRLIEKGYLDTLFVQDNSSEDVYQYFYPSYFDLAEIFEVINKDLNGGEQNEKA